MRLVAAAFSVLGALGCLYVPVSAYQNNLSTGYPFLLAIPAIGVALALIGVTGGLLTWRGRKSGPWLLLLGTIGGLVAWPWLVPAIIYLLATAISVVALRIAPRATGTSRFA